MKLFFQNIYDNKDILNNKKTKPLEKELPNKKLNNLQFKGAIYRTKLQVTEGLIQAIDHNPIAKNYYENLCNRISAENIKNQIKVLGEMLSPFLNKKYDNIIIEKHLELLDFADKNNSQAKEKDIAEYTLACFKMDFKEGKMNFLSKMMEFIKSNINLEQLNKAIILCEDKNEEQINLNKFDLFKKFINSFTSMHEIELAFQRGYDTKDDYWQRFLRSKKIALSSSDAVALTNISYEKNIPIEYFETLYEKTLEKKDILESYEKKITENDIKKLLFQNVRKTLNTIDFLGEETFFYSFNEKFNKVENYILFTFGDIKHYTKYDEVVEIINPRNSKRYKEALIRIKELKKDFNNKTSEEKRKLIKQINAQNLIIKNILKNSISDPQDCLSAATIYKTLWVKCFGEIENILPYLSQQDTDKKNKLYEMLNSIIFKSLNIEHDLSCHTNEKINFANSKYLPKLFDASIDFGIGLKEIIEIQNKYPELTTLEVFNKLPENIITKQIFEKHGIDYDKWTEFNPDSYTKAIIYTDVEKIKKDAILNLEKDLNDCNFAYLPKSVYENLKQVLNNNGYILEDNFLSDNPCKKLYRSDRTNVDVNDFKTIYHLLSKELLNNDFWKTAHSNPEIEAHKKAIKKELLLNRGNELRKIIHLKETSGKATELRIRKADMNNINRALFLGNDSSCCTGVGKTKDWTAPFYLMYKMFSCIEIIEEATGNGIGNAMCYMGLVDNIPSLIIDNVEIKKDFQYNETIKKGIIEYAKKLCTELSDKEIPVFIGSIRNKIHLDQYELLEKNFNLLGTTGKDKVYLDFITDLKVVREKTKFKTRLRKIAEGNENK